VPHERTVLVAGSGVDCDEFTPAPEREGDAVVVLPARLTWDKGVGDFVDAARMVRAARPDTRFALVGPLDEEYRASVPRDRLEQWVADGLVEWWGERRDMPEVLAASHVVVLPSRFEGFPKVLVEAAACERAVVASDVSGCRAAVRDGETGLLVPAAAPERLAAAIAELVDDADRRRRLARVARQRAETELSTAVVADAHVVIYRTVLEAAGLRTPWWRRRSRPGPQR
jgi:glycosyltransferase involved in cell wall biosynthesis